LPAFFVMCQTGVFWIKRLLIKQSVSCQFHCQVLVRQVYRSRTQ
jgi:hypothetical protein